MRSGQGPISSTTWQPAVEAGTVNATSSTSTKPYTYQTWALRQVSKRGAAGGCCQPAWTTPVLAGAVAVGRETAGSGALRNRSTGGLTGAANLRDQPEADAT